MKRSHCGHMHLTLGCGGADASAVSHATAQAAAPTVLVLVQVMCLYTLLLVNLAAPPPLGSSGSQYLPHSMQSVGEQGS